MLKSFSDSFTDILIEKGISKKEDREIIAYGFYVGGILLFNILTTLILGALFGMFLEGVLLLISFSLIRTYAGGYHHENPVVCYFMSSGVIFLALATLKYLPQKYITHTAITILIISIPIILKLAPVGTVEKPLDESEKKYFRKKLIINLFIEFLLLIILLLIGVKHYALLISLGICLSAVLLITDKLLIFFKKTK